MAPASRVLAVCAALAGLLGLAGGAAACKSTGNALENAAAKDPARCERDPSCSRGRSSYVDCTRQCVDDYECVQRCQQIQNGVDGKP
jgi:hypothetical protein